MPFARSSQAEFPSALGPAGRRSVSVVLPTYNSREFVSRAIDSVLGQEGEAGLELIVVDDQSTDGTGNFIARNYGADPRIRIFSTPRNTGPAHARNVGFAQARGEWIGVIDADDAWRPRRLAALLDQTEGADIVFDNLIGFDFGANKETGLLLPEEPLNVTLEVMTDNAGRPGHDLGFLKPIFRRSFLEDNGLVYPDLRCNEDLLFYLALLIAGGRTKYIPEGYYIYTTRVGSISRMVSPLSRSEADNVAAAAALRQLVEDHRTTLSSAEIACLEKRAGELVESGPIARFYEDWVAMRVGSMTRALLDQRGLGPALARKLFRRIRRVVLPNA